MSKTIVTALYTLFAVLILTPFAIAADGIDIVQSSIVASGVTGTLALPFTINNTGNTSLNISFSATVLNNSNVSNRTLLPTLPSPLIEIPAGELRDVAASVDVTNAVAGTYIGTIRALANAIQDAVSVTLTVPSNSLSVSRVGSGTVTLTGDAGQTVSGSITVRNDRNAALSAVISTSASFSSAPVTQTISFAAFEQRTVPFTLTIPSGSAPGIYPGTADVAVDGSTVFSVPLSVTVNPTLRLSTPSSISLSTDLGTNRSTSFTITNTGNQDLSDLALTVNTAAFTDDDGDAMTFTLTPATGIALATGASRTITLAASVPADIDPQTYSGAVTVSGSGITQTIPLSLSVANILEITDVELRVAGSSSERKISPGETFTVEIEVENIAQDVDLEDVEVEVFFEDSSGDRLEDDDGDDLDDDAELQDLDAGDDDQVTFTFTMPYDADDGDNFNVVVVVTARNAEDSSQRFVARHAEEELEVDKEDHDVEITRASFAQSTISCERFANLRVVVRNRGDSDEDVELTVQNTALSFSDSADFTLDRDPNDPDFEVEESFSVDLRNARPGNYQFSIIARYSNNRRSETGTASLTVQECGRVPFDDSDDRDDQDDRDDDRDDDNGRDDDDDRGQGSSPIQVRLDGTPTAPGGDFTLRRIDTPAQDWLFTTLLVLANVVMLVVVVGGIMKLRKR